MENSGIIYTGAKNVILSILSVLTIVPALAQVSYFFQKNIFFAGKNAGFESGSATSYVLPDGTYLQNNTPVTNFVLTPERNVYAEADITTYFNSHDTQRKFSLVENNSEPNIENPEISFKVTSFTYPKNSKADIGITQFSHEHLILYAKLLKQYAKKNGFDTTIAFFTNMGMLSTKKRFFVINLVTLEIEQSGLVSHGRGQGQSVHDKQYSNLEGSNSTSLGRYKISGKYNGNYGEAYKMIGLDSSNNNAYNRNIVLHSISCIPDIEGIMPACVSEGCPSVSTRFFSLLAQLIDARKKPVLLWIFDSNLQELVVEDNRVNNSLIRNSEQNNYKWNMPFQIKPELTFHKNNNPTERRVKYPKSALKLDKSSPGRNEYTNKIYLTMKSGYIAKWPSATVFHSQNVLPKSHQKWTRESVTTKPASIRTLFIPVDISYAFMKGKKYKYITHW